MGIWKYVKEEERNGESNNVKKKEELFGGEKVKRPSANRSDNVAEGPAILLSFSLLFFSLFRFIGVVVSLT